MAAHHRIFTAIEDKLIKDCLCSGIGKKQIRKLLKVDYQVLNRHLLELGWVKQIPTRKLGPRSGPDDSFYECTVGKDRYLQRLQEGLR